MNIKYRNANIKDIPEIMKLQEKYHISTISKEDKKDGFVTTLFTKDQFKRLIKEENGLSIACDGDEIIAYAMAASWDYWKEWPLFAHMIEDLPKTEFMGKKLSVENSYQYGPIAIDMPYRGTEVLPNLFKFSLRQMADKYPIMITFVSPLNPRSVTAHKNKLGMDIIKTFTFNGKEYYELGIDTRAEIPGTKK